MTVHQTTATVQSRPQAFWIGLGCAALAAMVLLAFSPAFHAKFVTYDDGDYVYENPEITGGLTWQSAAWAFTHVHAHNWHPLTTISHMLDCSLHGLNPGGHHTTSILIHAVNAALLFLLLYSLTSLPLRSFFAAGLFALHPLRVESVAWVAERKDVLSGFFFLLTLLAYVRYAKSGKLFSYGLGLFFFACGLMSKPMLVTLPLILLILDFWPLRRTPEFGFKPARLKLWLPLFLEKIPFFAATAASCIATVFAQSDAVLSIASLPIFFRIENALVSISTYLWEWIWPAKLAVIYPISMDNVVSWKVNLSLCVFIGISGLCALQYRKRPYLLAGWFWYLVMLIPVLGLVQVGSQSHADRYTYLPQIGVALAIVWLLADAMGPWKVPKPLAWGAGAAVLLAAATLTFFQARHWQSSLTLWNRAIAVTDKNYPAYNNRGLLAVEKGNLQEALQYFEKANAANPTYADSLGNTGMVYSARGDQKEAIAYFQRALLIKPKSADVWWNLGQAYYQLGDLSASSACLQQAAEIRPEKFGTPSPDVKPPENGEATRGGETFLLLGSISLKKDDAAEAAAWLQKAIELDPQNPRSRNLLAVALAKKGDLKSAEIQYRKAIEIDPNRAEIHRNFGQTLAEAHRSEEAAVEFQKALTLDPHFAEAHTQLANLYAKSGRMSEARMHYEAALQENPKSVAALNNLAWLLATAKDGQWRNGPRALALAKQAEDLTHGTNAIVIVTIAAANAESGNYDAAIGLLTSHQAMFTDAELKSSVEKQISAYRNQQAWRE